MPIKSEFFVPRPAKPVHLNLFDRCDFFAKEHPELRAFTNSENHDDFITFSQLKEYALSVGSYLYSNGFKKGEVLVLVIPNSWELPVSLFGAFVAGMTVSGASVQFTQYELAYQFKDSEAVAIVTDDTQLDKVLQASKEISHIRTTKRPLPSDVVDFSDLLRQPKGFNPNTVALNMEEDLATLPYSNESRKMEAMGLDLDVWIGRANLALLPQYHAMGLFTVVFSTWGGVHQIMFRKYSLKSMLEHVQKFEVNVLILVPAIINQLAESPLLDEYDLSSVISVNSGSAPLSANVIEKLKNRLPITVKQSYGMTEMSLGSHFSQFDQPDNSTGKLIANMEMKIVDIETENELGPNQQGELRVKGPVVMRGYKNRPAENAKAFDKDGFLITGDLAYYDDNGFLFICERSKELIKVKGAQVAPAELEDIILGMESIVDCAVVGIPDQAAGEVPRAFVVRKGQTPSEQQIKDYVAERVAHYKRLAGGVFFIEAIPRTPSGKMLRRKLKDFVPRTNSKI